MSEVMSKVMSSATYQTIAGQPDEVRRLLQDAVTWELAERSARVLAQARRVFLVGTGTSYHAAQLGQYLLRAAGVEAWAVPAFDFALYPQPLRGEDAVVLFSHRGTKLFSRQSLDKARAIGAKLVIITGQDSPLTESEALVIPTTAQERSSTHTASYVTALSVMVQIASFVAEKKGDLNMAAQLRTALKETTPGIEAALAQQDKLASAAERMGGEGARIFFAGPGPAGITAQEGALKCKEAAYVTAEGAALETFLHGPIVSMGLGDHLVLLNPFSEGAGANRTADIAKAAEQIGVKVWLVGQRPIASAGTNLDSWIELAVPGGNEICAALVQVVPLQLLSCYLAEVRGTNPDTFRFDVADYKAAIGAISL